MKNIKVIIGAGFGDEGKGLMTDYFANEYKNDVIVVRFSGGANAGHTVVTPESIRHVFSHFGSGSLVGVPTYLSEYFIVNPMLFKREYLGLEKKNIRPICAINPSCIVTTPYDMMINQIVEIVRSNDKHGSCGVGINETIVRNTNSDINFHIKAIDLLDFDVITAKLHYIKDNYVMNRLQELGVTTIPIEYVNLLSNVNIINNYINDVNFMITNSTFSNNAILNTFETLIFEGAQGLLLDKDNIAYFPHLTPSNTGLKNVLSILKNSNLLKDSKIEVCYITRSYMTRHGVGLFETECPKDLVGSNLIDLTNVPNPYQDTLRYGYLDLDLLYKTITKDFISTTYDTSIDMRNIDVNLVITHLDETNGYLITNKGKIKEINLDLFDNIYISKGMTRNTIEKNNF